MTNKTLEKISFWMILFVLVGSIARGDNKAVACSDEYQRTRGNEQKSDQYHDKKNNHGGNIRRRAEMVPCDETILFFIRCGYGTIPFLTSDCNAICIYEDDNEFAEDAEYEASHTFKPQTNEKCGAYFCGSNQKCCNDSCGICAGIGSKCLSRTCTKNQEMICEEDGDCGDGNICRSSQCYVSECNLSRDCPSIRKGLLSSSSSSSSSLSPTRKTEASCIDHTCIYT